MTLAERWGVDAEKALIAALLHDYCKTGPDEELKAFLPEDGPYVPTKDDMKFPQLWHGLVAAETASRDFGVVDQEILDAVAYHSTGTVDFNEIGLTLFVADHLEPTRNFAGVSETRREVLPLPLYDAAFRVAEKKLEYISREGKETHPKTRQMAEWLENHRSLAGNPLRKGVVNST